MRLHVLTSSAVAAAALLLALTAAGCGSQDQPADVPASTASTAAPQAPTSTAAAPSGTPSPVGTPSEKLAADVTVAVQVSGGKVGSVQNVKVRRGQSVQLTGTSDVADSLHVHGFDKTLDLPAGQPASLTFTAETSGVFEIETHETEKLVAKLTVT